MDVLQNLSPLALIIYAVVTVITSLVAPIAIEWYKTKKKVEEEGSAFEKTKDEKEHDSELRAIRLEFELAAAHDKCDRLAEKVTRVIYFVRTKDAALDYIISDLEAEMVQLGFESPDLPTPRLTRRNSSVSPLDSSSNE